MTIIRADGHICSVEDRVKWLQTAANMFDLVYLSEDGAITAIEGQDQQKGRRLRRL
jgi:hypothetical protein